MIPPLLEADFNYSVSENSSLPTEHKGHNQSSGKSSKEVPGVFRYRDLQLLDHKYNHKYHKHIFA